MGNVQGISILIWVRAIFDLLKVRRILWCEFYKNGALVQTNLCDCCNPNAELNPCSKKTCDIKTYQIPDPGFSSQNTLTITYRPKMSNPHPV